MTVQRTKQQNDLTAEFVTAYGIDAEDILFFNEKPEPFFTYEAASAICNQLLDIDDIDIEPVASVFSDSLTVRCTIISGDKRRAAVGVASFFEEIDGVALTNNQVLGLASARALRNTLKSSGIDLLKAHRKAQSTGEILDFISADKQLRNKLLAEAHSLGIEVGLIYLSDKSAWQRFLASRYAGIESSGSLDNEQLADLIAVLRSMKPSAVAA